MTSPWMIEAASSNWWRVHGVSQRRLTESGALRRTEDGMIRIVVRSTDNDLWTMEERPSTVWSV